MKNVHTSCETVPLRTNNLLVEPWCIFVDMVDSTPSKRNDLVFSCRKLAVSLEFSLSAGKLLFFVVVIMQPHEGHDIKTHVLYVIKSSQVRVKSGKLYFLFSADRVAFVTFLQICIFRMLLQYSVFYFLFWLIRCLRWPQNGEGALRWVAENAPKNIMEFFSRHVDKCFSILIKNSL